VRGNQIKSVALFIVAALSARVAFAQVNDDLFTSVGEVAAFGDPNDPNDPNEALPPVDPDAFEPDDSAMTARAVACNISEAHTISPSREADWLSLSVDEMSTVIVSAAVPVGLLGLTLFDPSGDMIDSAGSGGLGSRAAIHRACGLNALPAGQYRIRAYGYSGSEFNYARTCPSIVSRARRRRQHARRPARGRFRGRRAHHHRRRRATAMVRSLWTRSFAAPTSHWVT